MKSIDFGVKNPNTGKIIPIATTLLNGIIWTNQLARIFPNDTPVIIIKGKSDVKTIGDIRKLESKTTMFLR